MLAQEHQYTQPSYQTVSQHQPQPQPQPQARQQQQKTQTQTQTQAQQPKQLNTSQSSKKSKNKKKTSQPRYNDEIRTLPSGEPVNFGHSNGNGNSKNNGNNNYKRDRLTASPCLPDGSKPNFQPSKSNKPSSLSRKKNSGSNNNNNDTNNNNSNDNNRNNNNMYSTNNTSDYSLPDGRKPNFYNDKSYSSFKNHYNNPSTKAIREKKVDDNTYAGSSFHSSPEAFNLPKPSFKTSNSSPRQPVVLREPRLNPTSSNGFF